MMNNIPNHDLSHYMELADKVALQIISDFNDITWEWFEPYGINRQNYQKFLPMVLIEHDRSSNTSHFFLDGNYIFSIAIIQHVKEKDGGYSIETEYKQFQRQKEFDPEQED